CKDIAMHIAAANPIAISEKDLDEKLIESEREIYRNKALNDGKPEKIVDKIVDGQIAKYKKQICLMDQEFVKDPDLTIQEVMHNAISQLGENMQISRFVRYSLG
ncbi:elongation factor Ts, partial [Candidatus Cloacimonadota bacterium]